MSDPGVAGPGTGFPGSHTFWFLANDDGFGLFSSCCLYLFLMKFLVFYSATLSLHAIVSQVGQVTGRPRVAGRAWVHAVLHIDGPGARAREGRARRRAAWFEGDQIFVFFFFMQAVPTNPFIFPLTVLRFTFALLQTTPRRAIVTNMKVHAVLIALIALVVIGANGKLRQVVSFLPLLFECSSVCWSVCVAAFGTLRRRCRLGSWFDLSPGHALRVCCDFCGRVVRGSRAGLAPGLPCFFPPKLFFCVWLCYWAPHIFVLLDSGLPASNPARAKKRWLVSGCCLARGRLGMVD